MTDRKINSTTDGDHLRLNYSHSGYSCKKSKSRGCYAKMTVHSREVNLSRREIEILLIGLDMCIDGITENDQEYIDLYNKLEALK